MIISAAPVLKNELTALIGPTSRPVSLDRPKFSNFFLGNPLAPNGGKCYNTGVLRVTQGT